MERTTKPGETNQLHAMSQVLQGSLTGRMMLAARFGYQYGGDRNLYQALGYDVEISFDKYEARYSRQDIAKAVINRPISYTWKGDILVAQEGVKDSEFEKAWKKLNKDLKLKSKFVRLDKLSNIGAYGALLLGFNDVQKQEDFRNEITGSSLELLYVKPLHEGAAQIKSYVSDPSNERFGLPELYDVKLVNVATNEESTLVVHHSRMLHIVPEPLGDDTSGEPPLQVIWNRLMDLEKLVGGSAEMFWRNARPGLKGNIKEDYTLTPTEENKLKKQLDEYDHNLRRFLLAQGVDIGTLEASVSDPDKHVDVQIQMISAVTGIPKRILTGSERGELSSSQDITSWLSLIQTRREEYAEEIIMKPFIDRCMEMGVLPKVEDYTIVWKDLFAPSDKEKADVGKIRAETIKAYVSAPGADLVIPPEMFLKFFMGLEEEQLDEVIKAMEEAVAEEEKAIEEERKLQEKMQRTIPPGQQPPDPNNPGQNQPPGQQSPGNQPPNQGGQ